MIDSDLLIQRIDALAEDLFFIDPGARDKYRFVLRGQLVAMITADPDKMGTIAAASDGQICRMLELNIAKMDASEQTAASGPMPFDARVPPAATNAYTEEPEAGPKPAPASAFAKLAAGPAQPRAKIVYCCQCGEVNPFNSLTCVKCGTPLHEPVRATDPFPRTPANVQSQGGGNPLIPSKNPNALIAYYLGVFCILQLLCLGLPVLSIPAVIFGILGVRHETQHPEARGGVHAWVGIIAGGIVTVISMIVLFAFIVGISQRHY